MTNNERSVINSKRGSLLVAIIIGVIGLLAMIFTSDSFLYELLSVTQTLPVNSGLATEPTPECIINSNSFYIESGKIIHNDPSSDCPPTPSSTEANNVQQNNSNDITENNLAQKIYDQIGEYQIRSSLNLDPQLTAQIETIEPISVNKKSTDTYELKVNVSTLEQGNLPYSLILYYENETWTITDISSD